MAVDTSEAPLTALAAGFEVGAPDLIKPNAEELAGLVGGSASELEDAAAQGDPAPVVAAATQLIDRGVGAVLATLGAAGAVLVNREGAWHATPPPITPRSTVGAGDASLAGYLRATVGGAEPPERLRMAADTFRSCQEQNAALVLSAMKLRDRWISFLSGRLSPTYGAGGKREIAQQRQVISKSA